ncbi:MAG TPA: hypothetical protein VHG28_01015 [Longimicrobiaceae bacterium]|nr:hypothetical protein [Longimicrobiaceae bacterium]
MYYDDEGDLVIYLKDLRLEGPARAAVRRHLIGPGKRGAPDGPPAQIKFRRGRFSFIELNVYWHRVNAAVVALPGIVSTDLDERYNRVLVEVRNATARAAVAEAISRLSVPDGSVEVMDCGPDTIYCGESGSDPGSYETLPPPPELPAEDTTSMADSSVAPDSPPSSNPDPSIYDIAGAPAYLTDRRMRLEGGLQLTYRSPNGRTQSFCTIGFNVWSPFSGYVTASHCSPRMGHSQYDTGEYQTDAYHHQPKLGSGNGNYTGYERRDPVFQPASYWTARGISGCSGNYACRWSDASLVAYRTDISRFRTVAFGSIAKTALNSTSIMGYFSVSGKAATRLTPGSALYMVGSQSGLRSGQVLSTCKAGPVYPSNGKNNHLMCQDRVTFTQVLSGDSGAPVFAGSPTGSSVVLYGILSGGTNTYGYSVSHVINIEADLGGLGVTP